MQLSVSTTVAAHQINSKPGHLTAWDKPRAVNIRLTKAIIQKLKNLVETSEFSGLSEVISYLLQHRKVVIHHEHYNLDALMWVLADIRQELELLFLHMEQFCKLLALCESAPPGQLDLMAWASKKRSNLPETRDHYLSDLRASFEPLFMLNTKLSYVWLSK